MKRLREFGSFTIWSGMAALFVGFLFLFTCKSDPEGTRSSGLNCTIRERISINEGWRFFKYDTADDTLIYDVRPGVRDYRDDRPADSRPTGTAQIEVNRGVLKPWILPSGSDFIKDPGRRHIRPEGDPGNDFPFVQKDFDDSSWEQVDLPHDWAVKGPFLSSRNFEVGGSMGHLPSPGVAWYRKKLEITGSDAGESIFLDVDGAMSYAMVWLNGNLVGGWPFGYASWRLDLTQYVVPGGENQLSMTPFPSPSHKAFNGLALAIVRAEKGVSGTIIVTAKSNGHKDAIVKVKSR